MERTTGEQADTGTASANGETEGEMHARCIPDKLYLLGPRYAANGLELESSLVLSCYWVFKVV
jgi:hypothetical protein